MVLLTTLALMTAAIVTQLSDLAYVEGVFDAIADAGCKEWLKSRSESLTPLTGEKTPVLRADKGEICIAAIPGISLARTKSLETEKFWVCYDPRKCSEVDFMRIPLPCDVAATAAEETTSDKTLHAFAVEFLAVCVKRRDRALGLVRDACPETSKVIRALDECRKEADKTLDKAKYDKCPDTAIRAHTEFFKDLFKEGCHKKQLAITRCFLTNETPNLAGKPPGELLEGKCATKGWWRYGCTGAAGRQQFLLKEVGPKLKLEKECPGGMLKEPVTENPCKATENVLL